MLSFPDHPNASSVTYRVSINIKAVLLSPTKKICYFFDIAARYSFFSYRGKSLSCNGAKRNLSNPVGLIELLLLLQP